MLEAIDATSSESSATTKDNFHTLNTHLDRQSVWFLFDPMDSSPNSVAQMNRKR